jgi:hypothetical protein
MTIREYIRRRVRLNWLIFVLLLITTLVGAALFSALVTKLDIKLTVSIIAPLAMAIVFWRLLHIRCPRCRLTVGLAAAMEKADHCPNCDVSFDAPTHSTDGVFAAAAPQPLTIRKYLRRRAGQVQTYLIFGIVLVGIGFAVKYDVRTEVGVILGLVSAAIAILVSLAVAALTRCPRCSTRLGRAGARVMWRNPANNCSTCGASFDEPMPLRIP